MTLFQARCNTLTHFFAIALAGMIPISTAGTHIILSCLVVLWFLSGNVEEKVKIIFKNPAVKVSLLFFTLFLIGASYSVASQEYTFELLRKMSKLLYIPFLLPLFTEEKMRKRAFSVFVGAMILTFFLAVLRYYGGVPFSFSAKFTDACIFKSHIDTNLLMSFATFLIAHLAFNQSNRMVRYGLLFVIIFFTYYVWFMSEGRSGQIIYCALWILFFVQFFYLKGLLYGVITLSIIVLLSWFNSEVFMSRWHKEKVKPIVITMLESREPEKLISPLDIEKQKELMLPWEKDDSISIVSMKQRFQFLRNSLYLANERLWFGWGTGSFRQVYQEYVNRYGLYKTNNPHNEYVNVFFQLGIFGLLGMLSLFAILCKTSFQLPRQEQRVVQGILVAMSIGCLGNSWLMDFTSGYLFVLFIATCFGSLKLINHPSLKR